jgi:hypothetical protein
MSAGLLLTSVWMPQDLSEVSELDQASESIHSSGSLLYYWTLPPILN